MYTDHLESNHVIVSANFNVFQEVIMGYNTHSNVMNKRYINSVSKFQRKHFKVAAINASVFT